MKKRKCHEYINLRLCRLGEEFSQFDLKKKQKFVSLSVDDLLKISNLFVKVSYIINDLNNIELKEDHFVKLKDSLLAFFLNLKKMKVAGGYLPTIEKLEETTKLLVHDKVVEIGMDV